MPREVREAAQLFAMTSAEEAEAFSDFICSETGRRYEVYENIIYTPEGVGCSKELIVEDIMSFRKIQEEERFAGVRDERRTWNH